MTILDVFRGIFRDIVVAGFVVPWIQGNDPIWVVDDAKFFWKVMRTWGKGSGLTNEGRRNTKLLKISTMEGFDGHHEFQCSGRCEKAIR